MGKQGKQYSKLKMENISAVIITRNEEKKIERCIRSIGAIADETIVVDSFSTDRTEEICRGLGCKFVQHEFSGYGPQKRFAVSLASHDWILSLDADEELSPELAEAILALKQEGLGEATTAYALKRRNYYCKKLIRFYEGGYESKVRLFNRTRANWSEKLVHEEIDCQSLNRIIRINGDLKHHTYDSVEQHVKKTEEYGKLGALEVKMSGKRYSKPVIILKAIYRFFINYIIKLGFLDGYYGFKLCQMGAWYVYLKYMGGREK